jgi:hypothetical protein
VAEFLGLRSLPYCCVSCLGAAATSSLLSGVPKAATIHCLLFGVPKLRPSFLLWAESRGCGPFFFC